MAKKRQQHTEEEEHQYYVYLRNPLEFRRQLLESAKRSVHAVRSYHRINLIRHKKLEEAENFKRILREIVYLNKKLNERLPRYDHSKSKHHARDEPAPVHVAKPKSERTEIDKLEDSLAEIEKKLKSIK